MATLVLPFVPCCAVIQEADPPEKVETVLIRSNERAPPMRIRGILPGSQTIPEHSAVADAPNLRDAAHAVFR